MLLSFGLDNLMVLLKIVFHAEERMKNRNVLVLVEQCKQIDDFQSSFTNQFAPKHTFSIKIKVNMYSKNKSIRKYFKT